MCIRDRDSVGAWMDAVSIYIIPLGALLAGIIFYWVCPKGFAREQVETGAKKPLGTWFEPVTKYVFVGITPVSYTHLDVYKRQLIGWIWRSS